MLSRRGFIKSLAAVAALTVLPAVSISKVGTAVVPEVWTNKTFYLEGPLHIPDGTTVRNCNFIATESFVGNRLLILGNNVTLCGGNIQTTRASSLQVEGAYVISWGEEPSSKIMPWDVYCEV